MLLFVSIFGYVRCEIKHKIGFVVRNKTDFYTHP